MVPTPAVRRDAREERRARRADVGVGGLQLVLGGEDVGPAQQHLGRQPGGERRRARSTAVSAVGQQLAPRPGRRPAGRARCGRSPTRPAERGRPPPAPPPPGSAAWREVEVGGDPRVPALPDQVERVPAGPSSVAWARSRLSRRPPGPGRCWRPPATSEIWAATWACSVARYCSRARAFRLRMRPNRSSSQDSDARRWTAYCSTVSALPVLRHLLRQPVDARRWPWTPTPGYSSERWIRYSAWTLLDVEGRDPQVAVVGQRQLDDGPQARVGEELLPGDLAGRRGLRRRRRAGGPGQVVGHRRGGPLVLRDHRAAGERQARADDDEESSRFMSVPLRRARGDGVRLRAARPAASVRTPARPARRTAG